MKLVGEDRRKCQCPFFVRRRKIYIWMTRGGLLYLHDVACGGKNNVASALSAIAVYILRDIAFCVE